MENIENMDWEKFTPIPDDAGEMKKIRKSIRRRNWMIVLTSTVLVAALLVATVYVAIPIAEKQYWDPNTKTYSDNTTDLTFMLAAYTELFCPEIEFISAHATQTGFATYSIEALYTDIARSNRMEIYDMEIDYFTLEKGNLDISDGFFNYVSPISFILSSYIAIEMDEEYIRYQTRKLNQMPEYVDVSARVIFNQNLSMEEFMDFQRELAKKEVAVTWVGIQTGAQNAAPLVGIYPRPNDIYRQEINDYYPHFDIVASGESAAVLEAHFRSLLQYSSEQYEAGKGILPPTVNGENYYRDILDYIDEHGIYTYGCYVTASPDNLLNLQKDSLVSYVVAQDAWIDADMNYMQWNFY